MKKIQIIADSMLDIPKNIMKAYNIKIAPLRIHFEGGEYRDGVDLSPQLFYEKLSEAKELPKTSQVSPNTFIQMFNEAIQEGYEVICINGSSRASGTHQSAIIAKNEIDSPLIDVVDTMGLSMGGGLLVYEAAKMVGAGKERKEIVETLLALRDRVDHIFTVDTLEYLKMGGRLNPMKATIGTILSVKPILTVTEGLVDSLDKVRGSKRVMGKMIELAKERGGDFHEQTMVLAHANRPDILETFKAKVIAELNPKEVLTAEIGGTVGTHAGPGTLAIFYYKKVK
ncbi:degV family protein [Alkaliphilus metalliredigens QYMF]|uniref:DegV family protein n=1 Tax=Alkaliphilus metalliredigens (strain QYMF) TaxID=293826 RepID=A6TU51_ALKMQ|nr:DegV family protein [Alkaliphilus metalliredigens]ABR49719.1 degV family protein [Alkaliphilus metalliredigens QYMF]